MNRRVRKPRLEPRFEFVSLFEGGNVLLSAKGGENKGQKRWKRPPLRDVFEDRVEWNVKEGGRRGKGKGSVEGNWMVARRRKNGATGLHWIVRDGPWRGWSRTKYKRVGRRTISILIPPWGVDVARTNRREDANTDGTPLAMLWKRRERVRLQLVHTAYVRACVRLFRARCYQRGRVDLYPFYCRGILAFANTAGHAAPGFSPHDGISLFPSQGILNGFPSLETSDTAIGKKSSVTRVCTRFSPRCVRCIPGIDR